MVLQRYKERTNGRWRHGDSWDDEDAFSPSATDLASIAWWLHLSSFANCKPLYPSVRITSTGAVNRKQSWRMREVRRWWRLVLTSGGAAVSRVREMAHCSGAVDGIPRVVTALLRLDFRSIYTGQKLISARLTQFYVDSLEALYLSPMDLFLPQ